ncbi:MAG: HYR domain-containing protein [Saprospiraceae bacterium]
MKKLLLNMAAALFLWLPSSISQQITITGESSCVQPGNLDTFQITITNFETTISAQFPIIYDPLVLSYVGKIDDPSLNPAAVFFNNTPGEIRFFWADVTTPFGDPPPTITFFLIFNAIGSNGNSSAITFPNISPSGFTKQFVKIAGVVPNGNISNVPGNITIDATPPLIAGCPLMGMDTITVPISSGNTTGMATWVAPTYTDNCNVGTLVSNHSPGESFPVGVTPILYTATDEAGNTATCNFYVNVVQGPDTITFSAIGSALSCNDTLLTVPITVNNFDSLIGIQLGITWNPTILEYTGYSEYFNNNGYLQATYNDNQIANPGEFRLVWLYNSFPPNTLSLVDGDTILFLHFKLINPLAVADTIKFEDLTSSPPLQLLTLDANGIVPNGDVIYNDAVITIGSDLIDPVAVCKDTTVFLNTLGTITIDSSYIDNGSSDNCGSLTMSLSQSTFDCSDIGTNPVTLTVSDLSMNSDMCMATVTVLDTISPVAVCQGATVYLTNSGSGTIAVSSVGIGSTDNCGTPTLSLDINTFDCSDLGPNTVVLTATDASSNLDTCHATVIVLDTISPVAVCQGATVYLDSNGSGNISASAIGTGSTDNCGTPTLSLDISSFDCGDIGPNNVVLTATDGSTNTDTCHAVVTVLDTISPTAVCQPATIYLDNAGSATLSPTAVNNGSSDNCDSVVLSLNITAFNCGNTGPNPVVLTVTDTSGNALTCIATVTVLDTISPVALCQGATVYLDGAGAGSVTASSIGMGSTDNCGAPTLSLDVTSFNCSDLGPNPVVLTATDASNNLDTCHAMVIVLDTVSPVAVCQGATIFLGANGSGTVAVSSIGIGSSDNCGTPTLSLDINSFGCSDLGPNNVVLTATDASSNTDTCHAVVTVLDTISPVATCPAMIPDVLLQANGTGTLMANIGSGGSTDNCTTVTETSPLLSFDCTDIGLQMVVLTATDGSGNADTAHCAFMVVDQISPTWDNCPTAPIVQNNDLGTCGAVVSLPTLTATDNCDPSVSVVQTSVFPMGTDPFPLDTTVVTYVATDNSGNDTTCTFLVIVRDNEDPMVDCGADTVVVNLSAGCQAILENYIPLGTFSDNCTSLANLSIVQFPDSGTVITTTAFVSIIVTDEAGNSQSCNITAVLGADTTDPVIVCPINQMVFLDAACMASLPDYRSQATVSDNCTDTVDIVITQQPIAGTAMTSDTTMVTLTAADMAGNVDSCTFLVIRKDTFPPAISCPSDTMVFVGANSCSAVVNWAAPTVTDNCSNPPTITCLPPSGTTFPVGDSIVICIAEDDYGNKDTCQFTVTVIDNQLPTLSCRADTTVIVPIGTMDTVINNLGLLAFADNCGLDSVYYVLTGATTDAGSGSVVVSGTGFNLDTTTVTFYVVDESGNSDSCSFNVIVEAVTPLVIECPIDLTFPNTPGACNTAVFSGLTPTFTPQNILQSYYYVLTGATIGGGTGSADGETFNVGVTTVTYFAVSTFGDTVSCAFTIDVNDTQAPVFSNCPSIPQTAYSLANACGVSFTGNLVPLATDNCPGISINYSPTLGSNIVVGTSMVTATAQDASGNVTVCNYSITVLDTIAPVIAGCDPLANNPIQVNAATGLCSAIVNWTAPTATDNCVLIAFTVSQGPGTSFPVGLTPVEYVAVDSSGNVSKCQFTVRVVDNQPPVFTVCPPNQTLSTGPVDCEAVANWPQPTVTDNCGVVGFSCTHQSPVTFPVGIHPVSCSAVDAAGNTTVCAFTITVEDNEFPNIFNMPADTVVEVDPGLCGAVVFWQEPTAADNCALESFTSTATSGSIFPVGDTIIQYVAIDVNGNVEIQSFTITVEDNTAPSFTCPGNITMTTAGDVISGPASIINNFVSIDCEKIQLDFAVPAALDDCGPVSILQTEGPSPGQVFGAGSNTLTFLATDANGNQSTCSFEITILSIDNAVADVSNPTPCEGDDVFFFVTEYNGATYTWTDPQGNFVSNQPSFTYPAIGTAQSGVFKVNIQLPFNCNVQALVDVSVFKKPAIAAEAEALTCTDGTLPLNLTAMDTANAGVNQWVWEFPGNIFAFGQNQTIPNASTAAIGTYVVTATTPNGCTDTDTVVVDNITILPMQPTFFGTESTICLGQSVTLNGQQVPGATYHFLAEPMAGSGLIVPNPSPNNVISVTPTVADTFTYYFYVMKGNCASDTNAWTVIVEAPPALDIVVDGQTTCVDGTTSITLTDAMGVAASYEWFGPCISGTANGPSVVLPNVTASCSGVYTVIGRSPNGCTDQKQITLDITNQPPVATLAASQLSICTGGTVTLAATPNYGNNANFIWTGQNLPLNANLLQSFPVTLNSPGTYPYTFEAVVNGCTTAVATVEILVENSPPVNITVTGDLNCVDGTGTVILDSNAPGATSWTWTNAAGDVLSNSQTLVLNNVTAAASGSYFVAATSAIGCTSNGLQILTITDALPPIEALLQQEPCEDGVLAFSATTIAGATYEWRNPAGNVFASVQSPTISNAGISLSGTYAVTASKNGCTSSDDTLVTVIAAPIAVDETVVGIVNTPQSFNVVVNDTLASDNYTIKIIDQPDHGTVFIDSSQGKGVLTYVPDSLYRETDRLLYEICYTDCPELCDIGIVTLLIRYPVDQCVITTVITPNNDGINDEFNVSCLELGDYPLNELYIFNQWGDKVFEAAPYKNDWKGTWDGKDLPDGTYYFIFQRDPNVAAQKGFVMIYR